ncbi:sigma-70 family RNA polymerase sigma factor [Myxococcota bacterium]|nr:sigma-70 family RNA polymerase sigma factor [Myxococcota bacterium]
MRTPPAAPLRSAALLAAWQAHEGELRGWLRRATDDPVVAEDLLQDLFLKAVRQGERFDQVRNPRAWLFTAARNLRIDRLRLRKDEVGLPPGLASPVEEAVPVDSLGACLPRALAELDPVDAEVLRRCDIEGWTQAEYARQQGISLPGAKSRLQRARRRLKAHLTTHCQVRFDEAGRVCCFVPRPPDGAGPA